MITHLSPCSSCINYYFSRWSSLELSSDLLGFTNVKWSMLFICFIFSSQPREFLCLAGSFAATQALFSNQNGFSLCIVSSMEVFHPTLTKLNSAWLTRSNKSRHIQHDKYMLDFPSLSFLSFIKSKCYSSFNILHVPMRIIIDMKWSCWRRKQRCECRSNNMLSSPKMDISCENIIQQHKPIKHVYWKKQIVCILFQDMYNILLSMKLYPSDHGVIGVYDVTKSYSERLWVIGFVNWRQG